MHVVILPLLNIGHFFYFLIPYQHVYTSPDIWTFYLFVFNTIVKIFTRLQVLCFCNCVLFLSLWPYADITNMWGKLQLILNAFNTRLWLANFYQKYLPLLTGKSMNRIDHSLDNLYPDNPTNGSCLCFRNKITNHSQKIKSYCQSLCHYQEQKYCWCWR